MATSRRKNRELVHDGAEVMSSISDIVVDLVLSLQASLVLTGFTADMPVGLNWSWLESSPHACLDEALWLV
jgi:hypothetical protein